MRMKQRISRRDVLHAALALPVVGVAAGCAPARPGRPRAARAARWPISTPSRTAAAIRVGTARTARRPSRPPSPAPQALEPGSTPSSPRHFDRARARDRGDTRRGPFAGVPTFIKDLDDVRGLPTRSGSRSFGQSPATGQGPYVDALERGGLVFLGKSARRSSASPARPNRCCTGPRAIPGTSTTAPAAPRAARRRSWPRASCRSRTRPTAADRSASRRPAAASSDSSPRAAAPCRSAGPAGPVDISVSHAVSISVRDSAHWLAFTERTGADAVFDPIGLVADAVRASPAHRARPRAAERAIRSTPRCAAATEDTARMLRGARAPRRAGAAAAAEARAHGRPSCCTGPRALR